MSKRRPYRERTAAQEPGNRMGALGMFASLAGGWALIPEIPAVPVSWTRSGQALLIIGVALALFGLHYEWKGPRRWSALLPGLGLLVFTMSMSGFAMARAAGYHVESLDAPSEVAVRVPRGVEPSAAALVLHDAEEDADLMVRLSDALAREGVMTAPLSLEAVAPEMVTTLRERAGDGVPVGVVAFGRAGAALPELDELPIDYLVLMSASTEDGVVLSEEGPALLGLYGFDDEVINPHAEAQRLMAVFADSGRPSQNVQMFLGADHELRRSEQPGFLPAGFAISLVELLSGWMAGGGFVNAG